MKYANENQVPHDWPGESEYWEHLVSDRAQSIIIICQASPVAVLQSHTNIRPWWNVINRRETRFNRHAWLQWDCGRL